jgi:hypothetical protein
VGFGTEQRSEQGTAYAGLDLGLRKLDPGKRRIILKL